MEISNSEVSQSDAAPVARGRFKFSERQQVVLRVTAQRLLVAGEFEDARTIFLSLMQMNPLSVEDILGVAYTFKGEGMYREASELFQLAILLGPDDFEVALHMAECHVALGDVAAAHRAINLADHYAVDAGNVEAIARVEMMRAGLPAPAEA